MCESWKVAIKILLDITTETISYYNEFYVFIPLSQNCNGSTSTDTYYETDVFLSSWQGVGGYFNSCSNGMVVVGDENVTVMPVS